MHTDQAVAGLAATQLGLITRAQVIAVGGTDQIIEWRVAARQWSMLQRGVYLVGALTPTWEQRLLAACLAAGDGAVASHRAAAKVWSLDGVKAAPIELTVPFTGGPDPTGALVHRSRRASDTTQSERTPVTTVERTLLDLGAVAPEVLVERAMEDAIRRGLTTDAKLNLWLALRPRRGEHGAATLRRLLELRGGGRAAGSGAEVRLIRLLREAGLDRPVRQHRIPLGHGEAATVDLAWPARRVAVEFDGYAAHGGRRAWSNDRARENAIRDEDWTLRRFTWEDLAERPERIVRSISSLLCGVVST